jgi:cysteine desulfurase family protein (TIGR01976 family)
MQLDSILPKLRSQFPSLSRIHPESSLPVVYMDGPAGSQVPQPVIDAIADTYLHHNANTGGMFATSQEAGRLIESARQTAADWFGVADPNECIFGPNMTSLTFAFSRALAKTWGPGDRVLVTQLDHDANVTPWKLAADDAGAELSVVRINPADATLDLQDFESKLTRDTRLVAFTAASNSVGSTTEIKRMTDQAHQVGAEVYVDAVHWAPHRLIDVREWGVDYCVCSAYKFFGPHVGILWGNIDRLEEIAAYKLRPAPKHSPGKWMTGTPNFAAIAGAQAAIDYIASIPAQLQTDPPLVTRRQALATAFALITEYENRLLEQLIGGLQKLPQIRLFGITDADRMKERVPTISFVVDGIDAIQVAEYLASKGIFCWHGDYYAVDVCAALGQAERGMVRLGILHTCNAQEIERILFELDRLVRSAS